MVAGGVRHEVPFTPDLARRLLQAMAEMRELLIVDYQPGRGGLLPNADLADPRAPGGNNQTLRLSDSTPHYSVRRLVARSLSQSVSRSPNKPRLCAWVADYVIRIRLSLSTEYLASLVPRNVRLRAPTPTALRTSGTRPDATPMSGILHG